MTDSVHVGPAGPDRLSEEAVCSLYDAVGWTSYTASPERLLTALRGSSHVVAAWEGEELIGLARALSDDATIVYIQDILVRPEHQGRGIGRRLVQRVLHRYPHVRQKVLLTDDRPQQLAFYASLGFANTRELTRTPLNAFVIIEGVDLG